MSAKSPSLKLKGGTEPQLASDLMRSRSETPLRKLIRPPRPIAKPETGILSDTSSPQGQRTVDLLKTTPPNLHPAFARQNHPPTPFAQSEDTLPLRGEFGQAEPNRAMGAAPAAPPGMAASPCPVLAVHASWAVLAALVPATAAPRGDARWRTAPVPGGWRRRFCRRCWRGGA